jgi:hypothetical protein
MYDICLKDTFHIVQFAGTTFCSVAIFSRFQALSEFSLNNDVIPIMILNSNNFLQDRFVNTVSALNCKTQLANPYCI